MLKVDNVIANKGKTESWSILCKWKEQLENDEIDQEEIGLGNFSKATAIGCIEEELNWIQSDMGEEPEPDEEEVM